ncbi:MAG: TOBE domain-containing protein [Pseudohongiella sp.]|nr:TOBE domain-containing protein [Pseudohongiella sp.]
MTAKTGEFIAPLAFETTTGEISPRRLALLSAIARTGSISGAARATGMTYKAAWDAVDAMNNLAGELLVTSQHGGKGGGGAELTPAGHRLAGDLVRMQTLQAAFLAKIREQGDLEKSMALMRRLTIKSSARNMLSGRVESLREGGVNSEVSVRLHGGECLHAIVTNESAMDLELVAGREVHALIKASWIILAPVDDGLRTSARNRLCGRVIRLTEGEVNAEVVIELAGGQNIAAVITRQSLQDMGIGVGDTLCALIKASHIILGVTS